MSINRSLLERLRDPDDSSSRNYRVSDTALYNSILSNLGFVLNTTRGNCLIDDEYGLPHMTEIRSSMPKSVGGYEAAIRATIERHEPRLKNVRVRHSPHDETMELRFEISALIMDEDGRRTIRFETYADAEGRMKVK